MTTAALIVAAGRGLRAGTAKPKQYARLGDATVLARTVDVFLEHPGIDSVLVVIGEGDAALYQAAIARGHVKLKPATVGGDSRQASVLNGLRALAHDTPERVVIHDGVRPYVSADVVDRILAALGASPGAIAAIPVADTLKRADPDRRITADLDRTGLWRAQTPQGFRFADILAAHEQAAAAGRLGFTDDAAVAAWAGLAVKVVEGSERNRKLTTAEDIAMAEDGPPAPDVRTGTGFDVHRLVPGDTIWLCGVAIPHTHALEGHSDADVGLHALTDALLGAIGAGDIGQHFPDTDPRWKGASSALFLAEAARLVRTGGGRINHVDVTLVCQAPKIAPHREPMRRRIGDILAIDPDRVSVKATTSEHLGFTGRGEGIAALATATVVLR